MFFTTQMEVHEPKSCSRYKAALQWKVRWDLHVIKSLGHFQRGHGNKYHFHHFCFDNYQGLAIENNYEGLIRELA